MIEDGVIAKHISDLMLDFAARLDESVKLVRTNCPAEEFEEYRRIVGTIMAEILLSVLNPLYVAHPNLKPPELE